MLDAKTENTLRIIAQAKGLSIPRLLEQWIMQVALRNDAPIQKILQESQAISVESTKGDQTM